VSDATTTPPAGEPGLSEEHARQYAEQLRSAPAEQVVTEVLSSLLNLAQVKLGRRDARLLIDLCAVLLGHSRRYLSSDLSTQVDQALSQLRLAQVQAEGAAAGAPGGSPEPNDLAEVPAAPTGGPAAAAPTPAPAPAPPAPTSRLWVPGRDF
jgi:hypothetical protein